MNCIAYLTKLLANFVYLQYKIHSMHTDMTGALFLPVHSLLDEIYQFFGDDHIDRIKERARILGGSTPSSILELSKLTDIQEINSIPSMTPLLNMVAKDLRFMEGFLQQGIDHSGKINDLVTQNTLIDFADAIGKFRWKIESSLPSNPVANEKANPKNEG